MDELGKAVQLLRSGDIAGAEAACRVAEAVSDRKADALQVRALLARHRGDHLEALACMKRAVKLEPRNGDRRLELGLLAHELGAHYDAVAHLEALIAGCGDVPDALHCLGRSLLYLGQPTAAAQRLERAVQAEPAARELWRDLARAYSAAGRADLAVAALEEASRGCDDSSFLLELGEAYLEAGVPGQGLQELKQATRSRPDDCDAWRALGRVLRALGASDRALRAHQRAVQLASRDPSLQRELAISEVVCGRVGALGRVLPDCELPAPQPGRAWSPSQPLAGPLWLLADGGFEETLVLLRGVPAAQLACGPQQVGLACDGPQLALLEPWASRHGVALCPLPEVGSSWHTLRLSSLGTWLPNAYEGADPSVLAPGHAQLGHGYGVGLMASSLATQAVDWPEQWTIRRGFPIADRLPTHAATDAGGDGSQGQDVAGLVNEIAPLDLVVTEHPWVAHVAGAMGKVVWLVVPPRPTSFWTFEACCAYRSVQLLRTATLGGLRPVAALVREAATAWQREAAEARRPLRAAQG